MLRIFIGYDPRQAVAYNVLQFSIMRRASQPVSITPLVLQTLPLKREGLTPFTWSRFLVPWLCEFQGAALFLDSDMLCLGDVADLFTDYDQDDKAAYVSKNAKKFEWASAIMFDCGHAGNAVLTPDHVQSAEALHQCQWLTDDLVGDLPREWNHLVGYDAPRTDAKMVHFTQGLPIFPETEGSEYADVWLAEHAAMNATRPWAELMGRSVHAGRTAAGTLVAKLHKDAAA